MMLHLHDQIWCNRTASAGPAGDQTNMVDIDDLSKAELMRGSARQTYTIGTYTYIVASSRSIRSRVIHSRSIRHSIQSSRYTMSRIAISWSGLGPCLVLMAATLALLIIQAQGITRHYDFNVCVSILSSLGNLQREFRSRMLFLINRC
jgi:hypothetical protein